MLQESRDNVIDRRMRFPEVSLLVELPDTYEFLQFLESDGRGCGVFRGREALFIDEVATQGFLLGEKQMN